MSKQKKKQVNQKEVLISWKSTVAKISMPILIMPIRVYRNNRFANPLIVEVKDKLIFDIIKTV